VAATPPGYGQPLPPYGYYAPAVDYERTKRIDRTKTGILLILIGTLIYWIPLIGIIGYLLIFIGVILVILGRKAFGAAHARNAVLSVVIFIVGVIVVAVVAIIAVLPSVASIITPGGGVSLTPAFYASAQSAGLLGAIAGAIVIGMAEVLFTYALQAAKGRMFLWAAYGANLVLSVAAYVFLGPIYNAAVTQAEYNSAYAQQNAFQLLNVIPALFFAVADYFAWSRISRGEVPERPGGPIAPPPATPPPYPPQSPPSQPQQTPPPSGPAPPINPH
jgi:hypothetical protein